MFNEKDNIQEMLESLVNQSLKPTKILIGDNQSDDGSAELARDILEGSGIPFEIITVPRRKEFGKWNINRVYWWLTKTIRGDASSIDYVGTFESDLLLERRYIEKLVNHFESNPRLGIAGGPIAPDGKFPDSFPLEGGQTPWGANRLYSARCWFDLFDSVDLRNLPAWDSDHSVLAAFKGYQVISVTDAITRATRAASVERGATRGCTDCMHDLPIWWALFRFIRKTDPYYLAGFVRTTFEKRNFKKREIGHANLESVRQIYRYASAEAVISKTLRILGAS